ncbi:hypothetical protein NP493_516g02021 [Ridgeia piscesae]|uniref:Uncharacterized protein n=1 Tax=Ridgeia piscesae TaxID=27915 RepID=A0AAD9NSK4_RIDPI|nr:hypothetical protein NP493_516g02021 [Ridgeia piscesae]
MGVQTRTRACDNPPPANGGSDCIGQGTASRQCVCEWDFVPSEHCKTCTSTINSIGYVRDECRCGRYYQCELTDAGNYTATKRDCPACLYWDESTISCSIRVPGCIPPVTPKPKPTPKPPCHLRAVAGKPEYYTEPANAGQRRQRRCAAFTEFVESKCVCIAVPRPAPPGPKEITCIDFDHGYKGFGSTNWVWLNAIRVRRRKGFKGRAAYFSRKRKARIEIPRFSNSYKTYKEFAVTLLYKRIGSYGGAEVLISNGNCVKEPSIGITSHDNSISAQIITGNGKVTIANIPVSMEENKLLTVYGGILGRSMSVAVTLQLLLV